MNQKDKPSAKNIGVVKLYVQRLLLVLVLIWDQSLVVWDNNVKICGRSTELT